MSVFNIVDDIEYENDVEYGQSFYIGDLEFKYKDPSLHYIHSVMKTLINSVGGMAVNNSINMTDLSAIVVDHNVNYLYYYDKIKGEQLVGSIDKLDELLSCLPTEEKIATYTQLSFMFISRIAFFLKNMKKSAIRSTQQKSKE